MMRMQKRSQTSESTDNSNTGCRLKNRQQEGYKRRKHPTKKCIIKSTAFDHFEKIPHMVDHMMADMVVHAKNGTKKYKMVLPSSQLHGVT